MIKKLCCAFVCISSVFWLQSNGQADHSRAHKYLIEPQLPGVYITVAPSGTGRLETRLEDNLVSLTLHNNLRWSIRIMVGPAEPQNKKVRIDYEVLAGDAPVTARNCHVCTSTELKPGSKVLFDIADADLSDSKRLRIRYSYAWESLIDSEAQRVPWHYVFFKAAQ